MKFLIAVGIMSIVLNVNAQNRDSGANDDSTDVMGFNNIIAAQPSDPNTAVIAPMYCPNQTVSWTVGAANCTGVANSASPGVSRTVTATGTNTGSATYTCSAATNTFTGPNAGATCVLPPPPVPPIPPQPPSPPINPAAYSGNVIRTFTNPDNASGGGFSAVNRSGVTISITKVMIDVMPVVQGPGSVRILCFTCGAGSPNSVGSTIGSPDANGLYTLNQPVNIPSGGSYTMLSSVNNQNIRAQVPAGGIIITFQLASGAIASIRAGR